MFRFASAVTAMLLSIALIISGCLGGAQPEPPTGDPTMDASVAVDMEVRMDAGSAADGSLPGQDAAVVPDGSTADFGVGDAGIDDGAVMDGDLLDGGVPDADLDADVDAEIDASSDLDADVDPDGGTDADVDATPPT